MSNGVIKGRRFVITDAPPPVEPIGNTMKFVISLAGPSAGTSLEIPKMKYNKKSFFSLEWDDGSPGSLVGKTLFDSLTYTDGCGNTIPYTAALAINCGTGIPSDPGYNVDYWQAEGLRSLINSNWDIENHGMFHGGSPSADADVAQLNDLIRLRAGYQLRSVVVPTDFNGYAHAAFERGYIFTTAQSDTTFDEFTPVRVHKLLPALDTLPVYICVVRDFIDEWNDAETTDFFLNDLDLLLVEGAAGRDFERIGTHSELETPELVNGFTNFIHYLHTVSNDRVVVCSTREYLEYREMSLMPLTTTAEGNKLTVEIDISDLSDLNRWRDLSFVINTDQQITSVDIIEGITSTSFSNTSKLVNIFNQKKLW